MSEPVVLITDRGSIEFTTSAGDCVVDGCKMKGGNMVRFIVHDKDEERPVGFKICSRHFGLAVTMMMDGKEAISRKTLEEHYLARIECDHDRQMDNPICSCSKQFLGWHPSVGDAVKAWVDHVLEADHA